MNHQLYPDELYEFAHEMVEFFDGAVTYDDAWETALFRWKQRRDGYKHSQGWGWQQHAQSDLHEECRAGYAEAHEARRTTDWDFGRE